MPVRVRTALDVLVGAFLAWVVAVLLVGVMLAEKGTTASLLSLGLQLGAIAFGAYTGWQYSQREAQE